MKITKPSKIASYSWLGCLAKLPALGKITPHDTVVTFPHNSEFI